MAKCGWALNSPLEEEYHDKEWGVPSYEDRYLFEMLVLEGMQAGLSWRTILYKRAAFIEAFDGFEPEIVAKFDQKKLDQLKQNAEIIRHEGKLKAAINNAQAFLKIQEEYGSFSDYIWNFCDHKPIINSWKEESEMPAQSDLSVKISKDLKKQGFKFVGPVIIYSYMQAIGMINDHILSCDHHFSSLSQI